MGVKGGVPLTDLFADRTFTSVYTIQNPFGFPPFSYTQTTNTFSGSRDFVLGPTIEAKLPFGFAVEADALYRPIEVKLQQTTLEPNLLIDGPILPNKTSLWEFPVLAKYRLPLPRMKPYVEAGPSLRAIGASLADHMSVAGISAGIGIEARIGPLRITPEVHYTHWGHDDVYTTPYHAVSYPNQVEFLTGISTVPAASGPPRRLAGGFSKYLSIGVKGGLPFTNAFLNDEYATVTYPPFRCGDFSPTGPCTIPTPTVQRFRASRHYLVGPMLEIHLPLSVSIEGDALYGPVSLAVPEIPGFEFFLVPSNRTFHAWQFPVVAKYKFRMRFACPYVETGPTFRTNSSPISPYLSNAGVTAGVGAEGIAWRLRIAPEVRFVHWGLDAKDAGFYRSRRNQAQFLVGLSF